MHVQGSAADTRLTHNRSRNRHICSPRSKVDADASCSKLGEYVRKRHRDYQGRIRHADDDVHRTGSERSAIPSLLSDDHWPQQTFAKIAIAFTCELVGYVSLAPQASCARKDPTGGIRWKDRASRINHARSRRRMSCPWSLLW
jgi:hypothetical protein